MRYFIILLFLGLYNISLAQTESTPVAPKKDTIGGKDVIEEKESLKYEIDSDNNRGSGKQSTQNKKSDKNAGYKSIENQQSTVGGISTQNAVQAESTNFNLYKSQSQTQTQQRSPTPAQQSQMDGTVSFFETNAPQSFEYNYFKYTSGNYNTDLFSNLEEAEKLKPNNADVQVQMVAYHMIKNSTNEALVYLDKLIENKRLAASVVVYAEDVLRSVPTNGVLITHGFDDTYGVWYAQMKKGIRKDVQIISLDLMQSETYRSELKAKGFVIPNAQVIDVAFLRQFCNMNATGNISISLTAPKEYFKPMLSSVYLTGLVFEYKTSAFDNFWRNEALWNKDLKKLLVEDSMDEKGRALSSNYLPMLFQMRKVYGQTGEAYKVKEMDAAIDKIGAQTNKYQQVQKMKDAY
jgi:hypothetical protein